MAKKDKHVDLDTRAQQPRARLPRGSSSLPQELANEIQRRRLLEAVALEVGEAGYLSSSVATFIKRAGVSRKTFYEQFSDKDHCYSTALQMELEQHLQAIDEARRQAQGPYEQLSALIVAHLTRLDAEKERAVAFFVESVIAASASPLSAQPWRMFCTQLGQFIQRCWAEGQPSSKDKPSAETTLTMLVGGLNALVATSLRGEPRRALSAQAPFAVRTIANALGVAPASSDLGTA